MPRKKKRNRNRQKKQPKASAQQRKRKLDMTKASWWKGRIRAAKAVKKPYSEQGREVDDYFKAKHERLFNAQATKDNFMDFKGNVAVSVPKSAQIRNAIGPHLYVPNPARTVAPRTTDGVMLGQARVLEAYINKTPAESGLEEESGKQIDDSLLRGCGFMQTGWDDTLEIVTSWALTSRDVLIDGSAQCLKDAEWIAIRRIVPLFRLKREIDDPWRKRNLRGTHSSGAPEDGDDNRKDEEKDDSEHGPTNDLVEVWDVYSKMGVGWHGVDFPGGDSHKDDEDDFVKLSVVLNHEVLIFDGSMRPKGVPEDEWDGGWEAPLYLDRDWPIVPLTFVRTLDQLWAVSVMGQVLPLQKTLDLLASLDLINARNRSRVVYVGDKDEETRVQAAFKGGSPVVYLGLKNDPAKRPINQRFTVVNLGTAPPDIANMRNWINQEFEATTGLTSITTGVDDSGSKDRSATASRLRSQATNARLGHMKSLVKQSDTKVARHEAIMVRLSLDAEEVEPYCSPEDISLWLVSIEPPEEWVAIHGIAEIPVRDRRSKKEREKGEKEITLETLGSEISNYFEDPNEAAQACVQAMHGVEQLALSGDYRFGHLAQLWANTPQGFSAKAMFETDPETGEMIGPGLPEGVQPRAVTVADVWRDTAGITPKQLCRELTYEIGTSSGPEWDREREIETANTMLQQAMPAAMAHFQSTGDPTLANAINRRLDDATGVPDDKRLPELQPMQMQPPPGAEGPA